MATQKHKKNFLAELFCIFEFLLPKNPSNQSLQLSSFFKTIWKTVRKLKKQASRELFLPENDFQTNSTKCLKTNIQILETWKPTKDMKFRLDYYYFFFFPTCPTYKLNTI